MFRVSRIFHDQLSLHVFHSPFTCSRSTTALIVDHLPHLLPTRSSALIQAFVNLPELLDTYRSSRRLQDPLPPASTPPLLKMADETTVASPAAAPVDTNAKSAESVGENQPADMTTDEGQAGASIEG